MVAEQRNDTKVATALSDKEFLLGRIGFKTFDLDSTRLWHFHSKNYPFVALKMNKIGLSNRYGIANLKTKLILPISKYDSRFTALLNLAAAN